MNPRCYPVVGEPVLLVTRGSRGRHPQIFAGEARLALFQVLQVVLILILPRVLVGEHLIWWGAGFVVNGPRLGQIGRLAEGKPISHNSTPSSQEDPPQPLPCSCVVQVQSVVKELSLLTVEPVDTPIPPKRWVTMEELLAEGRENHQRLVDAGRPTTRNIGRRLAWKRARGIDTTVEERLLWSQPPANS